MELNTEHKCVQKMKRKIRFSRKKEIEEKSNLFSYSDTAN